MSRSSSNRTDLQPVNFGVKGRPVSAMLHLPPKAHARDAGVVVCPPLGRDNVFTHRPLHVMARHLAAGGAPVLHIDWPGAGDSAGDLCDPGIAEAWLESVGAAAGVLRQRTGVRDVTVVGMRVGAMLALAAAGRGLAGDGDLVLWAPNLSGRGYLRELAAFHAFAGEPGGGFPFGSEAEDGLRAIDLLELDLGRVRGRRVLVVGTDHAAPDTSLVTYLERSGVKVDTRRGAGLDDALSDVTKVPRETIGAIGNWIRMGMPMEDPPRDHQAAVAVIDGPEGHIREETITIETSVGRVVAVACMPELLPRDTTWVAFPSTAHIRRMGPSRLWTTLARAWAADGVPSVRFDVHGVGDSDGAGASSPDLRTQYCVDVIASAQAVLAETRRRYRANSFALIGLCSGATTALQLALIEPDISAVSLINAQVFSHADERLRELRRASVRAALRRSDSWRRLLRGKLGGLRLAAAATHLLSARARSAEQGDTIGARAPHGLAEALETLEAAGTSVHFVYADPDLGLDIARALPGGLEALEQRTNVAVDLVCGAGHTFMAAEGRARLRDALELRLRLGDRLSGRPAA